MFSFLNNQSEIGKVASLYVLFIIFTGAAVLAGFDLVKGVPIPPSLTYILGSGVTFAIGTLQFHMNTANVQQLATTIQTIQGQVPQQTKAVLSAAKDGTQDQSTIASPS